MKSILDLPNMTCDPVVVQKTKQMVSKKLV